MKDKTNCNEKPPQLVSIEVPILKPSEISTANCDSRKGIKKELHRSYGRWLRRYMLKFPVCCEYCWHVGEPSWHCGCPKSPQYGINVGPHDVCADWTPNVGLMMVLSRAWFKSQLDEWKKGGNA